jgi:sodium transport system ATP-binding protein
MSEVEKLCDRIVIIHKGSIVAEGTVDSFKARYNSDDMEDIFMELVGGESEK